MTTEAKNDSLVQVADFAGNRIGLVVAVPTGGRAVEIDNCNGAISWGIEPVRGGPPVWIAETDACHSAHVVVAPGHAHRFTEQLGLPAVDALARGAHRVVLYGVYYAGASEHAASDEVPAALRTSPPISRAGTTSP